MLSTLTLYLTVYILLKLILKRISSVSFLLVITLRAYFIIPSSRKSSRGFLNLSPI